MSWYFKAKKFVESKGWEYLGEDGGWIFIKENGQLFPIGEDTLARMMAEENFEC